jgi:hypothetical protein
VNVERITDPTDELVDAFARLVPQLSPDRTGPTRAHLADVLSAPGTVVLVARDDGMITGTLTLLLYRIPTGIAGGSMTSSSTGRRVGKGSERR